MARQDDDLSKQMNNHIRELRDKLNDVNTKYTSQSNNISVINQSVKKVIDDVDRMWRDVKESNKNSGDVVSRGLSIIPNIVKGILSDLLKQEWVGG